MARQAKTQRIIDEAKDVLTSFHPMTVRQVYYQLVSRQVIENNRSRYQAVSDALVDARLEKIIPWEWIEDRLRLPRIYGGYDNLAQFARIAQYEYQRDAWAVQPRVVECFPPDTPVITSTGVMSIGAIQVGDLVLTQDGRVQQVEAVMKRDFEGKLTSLVAVGFPPLQATPNHPILCKPYDDTRSGYKGATRKFSEPEFRQISQLKPFDLLMVPRIKGEKDVNTLETRGGTRSTPIVTTLDIDLCGLIGTYLAEGMVRGDNRTTQFTLAEDQGDVALSLHAWARKHNLGSHEVASKGARVVYIFGKALSDWLQAEFGSGAFNKRLPDCDPSDKMSISRPRKKPTHNVENVAPSYLVVLLFVS